MENLINWWTQSGPFFSKSGQYFWFSKRAGEASLFIPSCALVSVAGYASMSLNMPKYLWKCLNNLFWLCQGSEYAWSSYMLDKLLKMPPDLSKPGFWICHGCVWKGCAEFKICLIIAPYDSVMPEYTSICLTVPPYAWTWLKSAEYPWKYLKMSKQIVLTMSGFSICRDIVIITLLLL